MCTCIIHIYIPLSEWPWVTDRVGVWVTDRVGVWVTDRVGEWVTDGVADREGV